MPDSIRIDNFYLPTHSHVKVHGIHIPIKYKDMDEVELIIKCHIIKNNGKINLKGLKEELNGRNKISQKTQRKRIGRRS